jgi:hypothetical protein
MVLLPFEIKNRDNIGIYLTYCVYYYGGGQELLFCFYKILLAYLVRTWSDDIDAVFKVRD